MISHTDYLETEEVFYCSWCKKIADRNIKMISIKMENGDKVTFCPVCQNEIPL
ncbi:MAG: hypothetical protein ACTSWY_04435 [Promethearchaeota archaeon]